MRRPASPFIPVLALALFATTSPSIASEASIDEGLERVSALRAKGDFDAARTATASLVESHPESIEAHLAHQDLHLAHGREGEIRAAYLARTRADGATADDHFLYGRLRSGRRAVSSYHKALKLDPEHYWTHCALGDLQTEAGRLDLAEEHYAHAHAARPDSAVPLCGLGWVAERRGNAEAAEKYYRLAIDADAEDVLSRTNLGLLLVSTDRVDEARDVLEAAREKAPRDGMVRLALGMTEAAAGDLEAAAAHYEEASQLPGQTIESLNLLASTYTELERYDLAQATLERAIEVAPENETIRFNFGYLELARDDAAAALRWAKKILADDARSAPGHFLAGLCHERQGDAKEAERAYRRAVDLDGESASYHQALAALAATREDWRTAVKHHREALELTDGDPDVLLDLAFAQVGAGDPRSAAKSFEAVIAERPDDLVALMNLGLLYQTELRDRDRARAAYEEYLKQGGKDPRVRAWLDELR